MKNYMELFKETKTLNMVYWLMSGLIAIVICWFLFSDQISVRTYLITALMIANSSMAFLIMNKVIKYYNN